MWLLLLAATLRTIAAANCSLTQPEDVRLAAAPRRGLKGARGVVNGVRRDDGGDCPRKCQLIAVRRVLAIVLGPPCAGQRSGHRVHGVPNEQRAVNVLDERPRARVALDLHAAVSYTHLTLPTILLV